MSRTAKRIVFAMFTLSGFCSLLYQIVWMRMAFASFGIITPVMSVVISVFMLGLFVGSWASGRWIEALSEKTGLSAGYFYAACELLIGLGAFLVPLSFRWGESVLLSSGDTNSTRYLMLSALVIAGSLLPWCLFMGATFPCMMAFIKKRENVSETSFSFLYLANVIGAMAGSLLTAVVIIEALGFKNTLLAAAIVNFAIALTTLGLEWSPSSGDSSTSALLATRRLGTTPNSAKLRWIFAILFTTGFTSMAMEVVWTRAFTPCLRTTIYSFALLLFVYLLATWLGSLRYRKHVRLHTVTPTSHLIARTAVFALLPIVINDPRINLQAWGALFSIFPFCFMLGYLTPKLIDQYSLGNPGKAGRAYAINILGCILGPLVASYVLLPTIGAIQSLLLLSLPLIGLFVVYFSAPRFSAMLKYRSAAAVLTLVLISFFWSQSYEEHIANLHGPRRVERDHVATVISDGVGMRKILLVNGVGITALTTLTKVMAHLPLLLLPETPKSALVICFGMGTTFRSLSSWGIDATAVELVPSVKKAFNYYFDDADAIVRRPNARIVVDDGRRFLKRTAQTFDVITLDPPPPVEAAGSSLLYSEEFYQLVRSHLSPHGILQQWFPGGEQKILQAVTRSILNSFPYVRVFQSYEGFGGYHFLASKSPLNVPSIDELMAKFPMNSQRDLVEWMPEETPRSFLAKVLMTEKDPASFHATQVRITDDRPYNEYFMVRRAVSSLMRE